MKVFVWKSWGSVDVYALSTVEQVFAAFNKLADSVRDWGIDDKINELRMDIDRSADSVSESIGVLRDLIELVEVGSHETLEYGSGIVSLKE